MTSPTSTNGARNEPDGSAVPPVLPSIPLSPEPPRSAHDQSIGGLVREVTTHLSVLVRSEVELAKAEVTSEVRKGVQGSVFFVIALVIATFSLFFLFFTLAELFAALGVVRWGAFAIVFGIMLLLAGIAGLIGYLRVRRIRKPERTISTLKDSAQVLANRGRGQARPELAGSGPRTR